jgi:predicted phage baseplate assembly protein
LGNGDASATFQTFQLAKSPVTYVRSAGAPGGVASTLEVRVDNVLWHEMPTLFGHGPRERIYTTSRDNKEVMTVRFGDGVTGSRLSTGRNNVVAKYRQGLGLVGNVAANSLRNPLDRPVGLKTVTNPIAAQGGADAETLDQARSNAPNTVRTFGRIVSLRDFEDSAREFPGVARALATFAWDGEQAAVRLTVAGDNGVVISDQLLQDLTADLNARRDPNRQLTIGKHRNVPVLVSAAILVDADFVKEDVQAAVAQALVDHLAFANRNLGQPVHLSAIYTAIQNVPGVVAADVNTLQFKNSADGATHGATAAPQQKHLRIFADEIAFVESASVDIVVTLGLS